MNRDLEKWLEGVDTERRQKARANQDVRTLIAQDIRERIEELTVQRTKRFSESGQQEWMKLNRDEGAYRIDELRNVLQKITGVRE